VRIKIASYLATLNHLNADLGILKHQQTLSHWFELGLIVGSIPIILCALCLLRAWKLVRGRTFDYALPVAAVSVVISQGVHSAVDFSLEMPANVVLFLVIVALGITPRHRKGHRVYTTDTSV
jgi:hypothetical protein